MSIDQPGGGAPGDRDGTSSIPDEVWQQFIEDSEEAIRASGAPHEPAVRQAGQRPGGEVERARMEAVGELWQPEDLWGGPAWRDMDQRARRRRVGRRWVRPPR